jgi:hypothetical protein
VSIPVKHHFVPQFLLRRFGDQDERLTVHRLIGSGSFQSSVRDIGHRNDGHTILRGDGSADRSALEVMMSEIEGAAAASICSLEGGEPLNDEHRGAIGWFLGLQWHRHRYLFNAIHSEIEVQEGLSKGELQSSILRVSLLPFFSAWTQRDDDGASFDGQWDYVESALRSYQWRLVRYRRDVLVIGDNTLCMWGARPPYKPAYNAALARHGLGVPLHGAARVTTPLSPRLGLLMTNDGVPDRLDPQAFNRATIYSSREFVAHAAGWSPANPRVRDSFTKDLERQRWLAPGLAHGPF